MLFDDFPMDAFDSTLPERTALTSSLQPIERAIEAIGRGDIVIVVDDDDRENEGDLVTAASLATPEKVAFIIRHTSGILCTPMLRDRARALHLDPMIADNDAPLQTAFTVSVDYKPGLTTGISAEERARTIVALGDPANGAADFVRPGHIFPLVAKDGGVLARSGHTEAAVDLAQLANVAPVGLIAELVNDDGSMMRAPQLRRFAYRHNLMMVSIDDLIAYRQRREPLVNRAAEFPVDTEIGEATAIAYQTPFDSVQHLALVFGTIDGPDPVPVRMHREQLIEDLFQSRALGRGGSIGASLAHIATAGRGVLVYLREGLAGESRMNRAGRRVSGEGSRRSSAEHRSEQWREVGVGAQILWDLGISRIQLLTTKQTCYVGLAGFGIEVADTVLIDSTGPGFGQLRVVGGL